MFFNNIYNLSKFTKFKTVRNIATMHMQMFVKFCGLNFRGLTLLGFFPYLAFVYPQVKMASLK